MPLFDDILSQPAILISIGLAFLFIVAAVVLAVLPRIKASRARAQRRKVAAQAAQAEQEAIQQEAEAAAQATRKGGKRRAAAQAAEGEAVVAPAGAKAATPVAAAPVVPTATAAPAAAKPAAAPVVSATTSTTTSTKEDEVSPEMQDLLSSVFSDEDNSERQAILLKGIEPASIEELLILSKAVAAQLRGEQVSNIVRVKENQLS